MNIERNRVTGICLRRLRKRAGLTQAELAKRINKPQSFVSKTESAERRLGLEESYIYAKGLGESYDVFFKEVELVLEPTSNT